jgi:hypothetical protein
MVTPFYGERAVDIDGEPYTLVINFRAMAAMESHRPMTELLAEIGGTNVPISTMAIVLWGLLRARHGELGEDHAVSMLISHGDAVGTAISELLQAAFPAAKDDKPRPPKRTKASTS